MPVKSLLLALGACAALVAQAPLAEAGSARKHVRDHAEARRDDCRPYNGPFGYYGNPWCDGGYKFAEDYAPGTGPNLDLLDLPRQRRYRYWWE